MDQNIYGKEYIVGYLTQLIKITKYCIYFLVKIKTKIDK